MTAFNVQPSSVLARAYMCRRLLPFAPKSGNPVSQNMTRHRESKIETFSAIVLSLALATLTACGHSSQVELKAASNDQPHDSSVRYIKVEQQIVPDTLDLAAKVQPDP